MKLVKFCEVEVGVILYEMEIFFMLFWFFMMFRFLMMFLFGLFVVVRFMLIVVVLLLILSGVVDFGFRFFVVYGLIGCGLM